MSIVNDNIPEDAEMVSTTFYPADRERIGNHVTVPPNVATVTIQDDDGKHFIVLSSNTYTVYINLLATKITNITTIQVCYSS